MVNLYKEFLGHHGSIYALSRWSEQDQFLSAGGDGSIVRWSIDSTDGIVHAQVGGHIFSLCYIYKEKFLFAGIDNGSIYCIPDDKTLSPRNFVISRKAIYNIENFNESTYLVSQDGILTIIKSDRFEQLEFYKVSSSGLRSILHSKLRNELLMGTQQGDIIVFNQENKSFNKFKTDLEKTIFKMYENEKNSELIIVGRDARIHILDLFTLQPKREPIKAHWYTINDLLFISNTRFLVTASRDKSIRIWEVESFELLYEINFLKDKGHKASVNKLLWLESANVLLSASDDRSIKAWKIRT